MAILWAAVASCSHDNRSRKARATPKWLSNLGGPTQDTIDLPPLAAGWVKLRLGLLLAARKNFEEVLATRGFDCTLQSAEIGLRIARVEPFEGLMEWTRDQVRVCPGAAAAVMSQWIGQRRFDDAREWITMAVGLPDSDPALREIADELEQLVLFRASWSRGACASLGDGLRFGCGFGRRELAFGRTGRKYDELVVTLGAGVLRACAFTEYATPCPPEGLSGEARISWYLKVHASESRYEGPVPRPETHVLDRIRVTDEWAYAIRLAEGDSSIPCPPGLPIATRYHVVPMGERLVATTVIGLHRLHGLSSAVPGDEMLIRFGVHLDWDLLGDLDGNARAWGPPDYEDVDPGVEANLCERCGTG